MNSRGFVRTALSVAFLLLLNGCATQALWEEHRFASFREPAPQPNLQLFQSQQAADVLVLYDELTEKDESIRRRAYYLQLERLGTGSEAHSFEC